MATQFEGDRSAQESAGDDERSSAVKKLAVGAAGATVTAAGVVMLVTPGPGILVTAAGLAILAREFPAAERGLQRIKDRLRSIVEPDEPDEPDE
jgi:hypothetical protein